MSLRTNARLALATIALLASSSGASLAGGVFPPRSCSAGDAGTTINVGGDDPAWLRFCGPASGVLRLDGRSYAISRGYCTGPLRSRRPEGGYAAHRMVLLGLVRNGAPPHAAALVLSITPGNRAGLAHVDDGLVEIPGHTLTVRGSAVVADDRNSGTFTLIGSKPTRTRVTGSWRCY